jgi:hypothetical protein
MQRAIGAIGARPLIRRRPPRWFQHAAKVACFAAGVYTPKSAAPRAIIRIECDLPHAAPNGRRVCRSLRGQGLISPCGAMKRLLTAARSFRHFFDFFADAGDKDRGCGPAEQRSGRS